jgi:hypothetical protein
VLRACASKHANQCDVATCDARATRRNATQRPSGSGERADAAACDLQSMQSTHTACHVPQVFETPEVVRVYVGSFWAAPLKNSENSALFAKVAVGAAPSNARSASVRWQQRDRPACRPAAAPLALSPLAAASDLIGGREPQSRRLLRVPYMHHATTCSARHIKCNIRLTTCNIQRHATARATRGQSGTQRHSGLLGDVGWVYSLYSYSVLWPTTAVLTLPRGGPYRLCTLG